MRWLIALALVLLASSVEAADKYVTTTGGGSFNGSDWNNACNGFTGSCAAGSALVRGDTYYVADGDYSSDSSSVVGVSFVEPLSGTTRITIKKATVASHGTSTGWSDTMGDGEAIFDTISFGTGYWTIDGQVGAISAAAAAAGSAPETTFGFRITTYNCAPGTQNVQSNILMGAAGASIDLHYVNVEGCGTAVLEDGTAGPAWPTTCTPTGGCGLANDGINDNNAGAATTDRNWSHLYIHDFTRNPITINDVDDVLMEHLTIARVYSSDLDIHGQCMQFTRPPMDNITVRYSTFIDVAGTACLSMLGGAEGTYSNIYFYGNLLFTSAGVSAGVNCGSVGQFLYSPGAVYGREHNSGTINYNGVYVYNNTFYETACPETFISNVGSTTSTNIVNQNNIYVNSVWQFAPLEVDTNGYNYYYNNSGGNVPSGENNQQNGSGDPFVNAAAYNFALSADTNAGTTLASPFDTDPLGVTRAVDGTWTRGAFEFDSGSDAAVGTVTITFTVEGVGSSTSGSSTGPIRIRRPIF